MGAEQRAAKKESIFSLGLCERMAANNSEDSSAFSIDQVINRRLAATGESREKGYVASAAEAETEKHHSQKQQQSMAAASTRGQGRRQPEWKRKLDENFKEFEKWKSMRDSFKTLRVKRKTTAHAETGVSKRMKMGLDPNTGVLDLSQSSSGEDNSPRPVQQQSEAAASTGVQGNKRGRKPRTVSRAVPENKRGRKSKVKKDTEEFRGFESKGIKLMWADNKTVSFATLRKKGTTVCSAGASAEPDISNLMKAERTSKLKMVVDLNPGVRDLFKFSSAEDSGSRPMHHSQPQQLSDAAACTNVQGKKRGRKPKTVSRDVAEDKDSRPVDPSQQQHLSEAAPSTGILGNKRGRKPQTVSGDVAEKRGRKSKVKEDPKEVEGLESTGSKLMVADPNPGVRPVEDEKRNAPAQKIPGLTCHQCKRNDKGSVVHCTKCKKRYCHICIKLWYPSRELDLDYIAEACPWCRDICNCRACLQRNPEVKIDRFSGANKVFLQKVIYSGFSVLKKIHNEEMEELKLEARIQCKPVQQLEIPKYDVGDLRHTCDKCKTCLVNLHRHCDDCNDYDLCLACCRMYREERSQTGGDSSISCGADSCGGLLKLKFTSLGPNWVANILEKAEDHVFKNCQIATASTDSVPCSMCLKLNSDKLRRAASRENSCNHNYLYCPTVQDVKADEIREHFQEHLRKGEPVIVRNVLENTKGLSWEPMVMWRAFREPRETKDKKEPGKPKESNEVSVINCRKWQTFDINIHKFFTAYEEEGCPDNPFPHDMLKLKDWPPAQHFEERLPRHCAEFISALPFKEYTHPKSGILNLATRIPEGYAKPDLGPKTYIAFGRREEHPEGGDSVTNLHCDMADAVNVIMYTVKPSASQPHERDGVPEISNAESGNALWDIFRREDIPKLQAYLKAHREDFKYYNGLSAEDVQNPIHDQLCYLKAKDKRKLKEEYGVEAWTFEQHLGEAVFIPAGCPHQVRNLTPCIKVALDFVSPENLPQCIRFTEELRLLDGHPSQEDKLGVKKMVVYAVESALKDLTEISNKGKGLAS